MNPQTGEMREWTGTGWRAVDLQPPTDEMASAPTEADVLHPPQGITGKAMYDLMSPEQQKAMMDRGFQRSIGGESMLMGAAVPVANLIGKGVGMLRTMAGGKLAQAASEAAPDIVGMVSPRAGNALRTAQRVTGALKSGGKFGPTAAESAPTAASGLPRLPKPLNQMSNEELIAWARGNPAAELAQQLGTPTDQEMLAQIASRQYKQ